MMNCEWSGCITHRVIFHQSQSFIEEEDLGIHKSSVFADSNGRVIVGKRSDFATFLPEIQGSSFFVDHI